jgi:hypothetical protein
MTNAKEEIAAAEEILNNWLAAKQEEIEAMCINFVISYWYCTKRKTCFLIGFQKKPCELNIIFPEEKDAHLNYKGDCPVFQLNRDFRKTPLFGFLKKLISWYNHYYEPKPELLYFLSVVIGYAYPLYVANGRKFPDISPQTLKTVENLAQRKNSEFFLEVGNALHELIGPSFNYLTERAEEYGFSEILVKKAWLIPAAIMIDLGHKELISTLADSEGAGDELEEFIKTGGLIK